MRNSLKIFYQDLKGSFRDLLPIVLVVAFFQIFIIKAVPDGLPSIVTGLFIVAIGLALFIRGLEIGIFPNPAHDYTTFTKIDEILQKNVDIKIFDIMGKHIQNIQISEFEQSYQWDILDLPNGVYFCLMYLDGELFGVEKLIKQ